MSTTGGTEDSENDVIKPPTLTGESISGQTPAGAGPIKTARRLKTRRPPFDPVGIDLPIYVFTLPVCPRKKTRRSARIFFIPRFDPLGTVVKIELAEAPSSGEA